MELRNDNLKVGNVKCESEKCQLGSEKCQLGNEKCQVGTVKYERNHGTTDHLYYAKHTIQLSFPN